MDGNSSGFLPSPGEWDELLDWVLASTLRGGWKLLVVPWPPTPPREKEELSIIENDSLKFGDEGSGYTQMTVSRSIFDRISMGISSTVGSLLFII